MRSAKRILPFSALVSLTFFIASPFAIAQKAAHAATSSLPSQHGSASPSFTHATPVRAANNPPGNSAVHRSHSSRATIHANASSPRSFARSLTPAPGPGFEFGFLNGANPGYGPVRGRRNGPGQNSLGFGSGFYLLSPGGYYLAPADDSAAPAAEDQQASEQISDEGQDQSQPREALATEESVAERAQDAQVQDEGEFTLVLHDGSRISALAFTHSNDTIIYISPDGGRRTFAIADLDADATVRVNQERGTPLQLPL